MSQEVKVAETILVLTTIGGKVDPETPMNWPDNYKDRTVGWYPVEDLQALIEGISRNMCDLWECGYYQWAVIEETRPGTYPDIVTTYWFAFDEAKKGYFPCDPPEWSGSTHDRVWITCEGRRVEGIITLASPNGKSLMLNFEAVLEGHVMQMPVLLHDDGVFRSIFNNVPVELERRGAGNAAVWH